MNANKLKSAIKAFGDHLSKTRLSENIHLWESQHNFKTKWDIASPQVLEMYESSLRNETTVRLWERERWSPKQNMKALIGYKPEVVRECFTELFHEQPEPVSRIAYFKRRLDEVLSGYKRANPKANLNNHYHDDNEMVFLYLSFRFPEKFTLWDFASFHKFMLWLEVREAPLPYDTDRFIKATNIFYTFLMKDPQLGSQIKKCLSKDLKYLAESRLIVFAFYQFASQNTDLIDS